jgi:hypothetical protein
MSSRTRIRLIVCSSFLLAAAIMALSATTTADDGGLHKQAVQQLSSEEVDQIVTEAVLDRVINEFALNTNSKEASREFAHFFPEKDRPYFAKLMSNSKYMPAVVRVGRTLIVSDGSNQAKVEIISIPQRRLKVNGHLWVLDPQWSIREQYENFKVRLFPKDQFSLFNYVIPPAYSEVPPYTVFREIAGWAAMFGIANSLGNGLYCYVIVHLWKDRTGDFNCVETIKAYNDLLKEKSVQVNMLADLEDSDGKNILTKWELQGGEEKHCPDVGNAGKSDYEAVIRLANEPAAPQSSVQQEPWQTLKVKFSDKAVPLSGTLSPLDTPTWTKMSFRFDGKSLICVDTPSDGHITAKAAPTHTCVDHGLEVPREFEVAKDLMKFVEARIAVCNSQEAKDAAALRQANSSDPRVSLPKRDLPNNSQQPSTQ